MIRRILALALIVSTLPAMGALRATAQQPSVANLSVGGVTLDGGTLVASVSAVDSTGNPVRGLTAASLAVTVDGQPVAVSSLIEGSDRSLPLALIVVLDTSGSMEGAPLATAKQAIRPMLQSLQAGDRATLISFGTKVTTTVPLTADVAALVAGLDKLPAVGSTALYGAVTAGAKAAEAATEPRKAVVLLSDGEEFGNVSGVTREEALASAKASNAPFFVVAFGAEADEAFLRAVAEQGAGGQFLSSKTNAELEGIYAKVSDRLRLQYTVRVPLPAGLKSGSHRVAIAAGGAKAESSFEIAAAATLPPRFQALPGPISEATAVQLLDVPAGATVRFTVDGQAAAIGADGYSTTLDPWKLDPAKAHQVVAEVDSGGSVTRLEMSVAVAALAPRLLGPETLDGAVPGTTVTASVQAQPGAAVAVAFLVDGKEAARATAEPYAWTVPAGLSGGHHEIGVRLESTAGSDNRTFQIEIAAPAGGGKTLSLLYGGICAGVVLLIGAVLWVVRFRGSGGPGAPRPEPDEPMDVSGVGEQLAGWAEGRRGGKSRRKPAPPPAPVPVNTGWGFFTVVRGDGQGTRYPLVAPRELVGRGKFCSVRLADRNVEEAHFVMTSDGSLFASTPSCAVVVDGEGVRSMVVDDGASIEVGATVLQFTRVHPSAMAQPA